MVGDYGALLAHASAYLSFTGYLDTQALKERGEVKTGFDQARRVFIYQALNQEPNPELLKAAVSADLDQMEASNGPCLGEYRMLREELLKHIDKQGGSGAIVRFATRWALPAFSVTCFFLYAYIKFWSS